MNLIEQFQVVLVFLLVGVGMIVGPMIGLVVLRPHKPTPEKLMPYECGRDPIGDAQVCFDMRFYTDALIFLVFEVETVFLFPWARVFNDMGAIALFEGLVFIVILFSRPHLRLGQGGHRLGQIHGHPIGHHPRFGGCSHAPGRGIESPHAGRQSCRRTG